MMRTAAPLIVTTAASLPSIQLWTRCNGLSSSFPLHLTISPPKPFCARHRASGYLLGRSAGRTAGRQIPTRTGNISISSRLSRSPHHPRRSEDRLACRTIRTTYPQSLSETDKAEATTFRPTMIFSSKMGQTLGEYHIRSLHSPILSFSLPLLVLLQVWALEGVD